jgi:hypothetical protein
MRILLAAALAVLNAGAAFAAPSVDAILAANRAATGGDAWSGKGSLSISYDYAGDGLTGFASSEFDIATGYFHDSQRIGPNRGGVGWDGRQAWMQDASGLATPQGGGDSGQLAINEAYRNANLWWRRDRGGARIELLPRQTEAGVTYDVLRVTPKGGKAFNAWFDTTSHVLARTVETQAFQTLTVFFSDYRAVGGAMVPGKLVVDDGNGPDYRQTETFKSAAFGPAKGAAAFAMPKTPVTDASIDNPAGRTTVPFQLLNNHIYAQVKVNGQGPFLFIFDTGGHDLLTPETAKALAVASQGAAPGAGAGDNIVQAGLADGVTFQIGDLTIRNQAIAVVPFEAPTVEGVVEKGMIGFEVFRRFVTVIDYQARTLTFIDPARFNPRGAGVAVPFKFSSHLPEVQGAFEGIPGLYNIDTGSRVDLSLTGPFVKSAHLMATHPKGVTVVEGWGVGGPSRAYVTRGRSLSLGPVVVHDVVAGLGGRPVTRDLVRRLLVEAVQGELSDHELTFADLDVALAERELLSELGDPQAAEPEEVGR